MRIVSCAALAGALLLGPVVAQPAAAQYGYDIGRYDRSAGPDWGPGRDPGGARFPLQTQPGGDAYHFGRDQYLSQGAPALRGRDQGWREGYLGRDADENWMRRGEMGFESGYRRGREDERRAAEGRRADLYDPTIRDEPLGAVGSGAGRGEYWGGTGYYGTRRRYEGWLGGDGGIGDGLFGLFD